ncbi:MAG: sigma-70 family RNA polymerase sigma factor [Planctomycetaceae bacterium]|nr:sigma-70 family RNA polymerase sigma factor [Planctomycetaceae bacterium]
MDAADHELLKAVSGGDGLAFAELVRRYQRLVRWRLARLVPDHHVDDLAQEVFVDLAKALRGPLGSENRPPSADANDRVAVGSLAAWLVAVARRKAANHFRSTQRYEGLLNRYQQQRSENTREGETLLEQDSDSSSGNQLVALAECLELLQPKYREIVDGYYAQGQSAEVLAVHTARTPGAIRMILMRIRRSLAKCISRKRTNESPGPNS